MPKEKAMLIVDEFKLRGGAFVEDDYLVEEDGTEVYNPLVNREEAEGWLLDKLMELKV